MPHAEPERGRRAEADRLLQEIADYALAARIDSAEAWTTARYCLLDALGCGLLALGYPACSKLIGPVVPEAVLPGGARVPGTRYELDPVQAAFCIGAMVRWLDFNDTWLAAEWGHPSDNLGGILAVADYLGRRGRQREGRAGSDHALGAGGADQGLRDPGRPGAQPRLQPRRPGSRPAGPHRLDGGGRARCWAARGRRSSTPSPTPSSTAGRCAPTAMRPTPDRESPGPPATRRAARCGWP